ncbi:CoB--CoM heterodisulfide reductase subunit C [Methanolobus sediminis]|uniref:CoB--CoM heterodisulfide reductase subunit C n=1 Tax=Methanolobus sediminis TaxID=3072978 RepID=A0AA51UM26_9EURY|nr:CoB--CoM heterodisulfide reductase subunit C [Methanolobus sediminis]WMW26079.1 CoB--CoM heterodisulfide reductase subunit C [Methanolobus sediminis]
MDKIPREDIDIKKQLKEVSTNALRCMQCGVCSSSCPSGRHTNLNIRKLVKNAGTNSDILKSEELWMCTTCYNCQERCPRRINIVDTVLEIRSISAHQGIILPEHRLVCQMLLKYGHAVPINDKYKIKRVEIGLEELPETVHKYTDSLNEVKELLTSCGFERFAENNTNEKQTTEITE